MERVRLRWFQGELHDLARELQRRNFSQYARPEGWQPAVNAYRCDDCIKVCVDLAGVDKAEIDLSIEPRRLTIRGVRLAPEPSRDEPVALQILAMEIDHGPFVRELILPVDVLPEKSSAVQQNGLLWINLTISR